MHVGNRCWGYESAFAGNSRHDIRVVAPHWLESGLAPPLARGALSVHCCGLEKSDYEN